MNCTVLFCCVCPFPVLFVIFFAKITRYLSSEFFILYKSQIELIMIFVQCVRLWNPLSKVNATPLVKSCTTSLSSLCGSRRIQVSVINTKRGTGGIYFVKREKYA